MKCGRMGTSRMEVEKGKVMEGEQQRRNTGGRAGEKCVMRSLRNSEGKG